MKVICIDAGNYVTEIPKPIEGNSYTVIDQTIGPDNLNYYMLKELYNPLSDDWHAAYRFVPLSSIDETESESYKNLSHAIQ